MHSLMHRTLLILVAALSLLAYPKLKEAWEEPSELPSAQGQEEKGPTNSSKKRRREPAPVDVEALCEELLPELPSPELIKQDCLGGRCAELGEGACKPFELIFGVGAYNEADEAEALRCALRRPSDDLSKATIMMAYVRGTVLKRNLKRAIAIACVPNMGSLIAQQNRVVNLYRTMLSCTAPSPVKAERCERSLRSFNYCAHVTSGYMTRRCFMIHNELSQRESMKSYRAQAPRAECSPVEPDPIERFSYRYELIGEHGLKLKNSHAQHALTALHIQAQLEKLTPTPKRMIYLQGARHSVIFPHQKPQVSHQGSMAVPYLLDQFSYLDGRLIETPAWPITNRSGEYALWWAPGGLKYGTSLMALDLKTGSFTVIGDRSNLPNELFPKLDYGYEPKLEIKLKGPTAHFGVWPGFIAQGDETLGFIIRSSLKEPPILFDLSKERLMSCAAVLSWGHESARSPSRRARTSAP